ncbi:LuxR C-terminal-related transcriptional regulator [Paraburkholderia nemoris]|uniref:LuxR C-terminal-related transcriptional regulator n=1 Tax=Paraburkholderia nemoris TaxID=2793076 RepID=UPI0038BC28B6
MAHDSKFRPIVHTDDAIARPRLIDAAFDAVPRAARVVVVCAPAGFGKSTLLAQLAQVIGQRGEYAAWLNCDQSDVQPEVFVGNIVAALREADVDIASHSNARDIVDAINDQPTGCTIFIDEYEVASNPGTDRIIQLFARELDDGRHVVIGTREAAQISDTRLQLSGVVRVVDAAALRFSRHEASELLVNSAGADSVDEYFRYSEGWPFVLQLLRLRGQAGVQLDELSHSEGHAPVRQIFEYLTREIFDALDETLREFLLDVCLLDEVDVPAANAVRCRNDSAEFIWQLAALKPIVFVKEQPLGARLHPLLRDFLRNRFERIEPERFRQHHVRAAHYHAGSGHTFEAVKHAVQSGGMALASSLLLEAGGIRLLISEGLLAVKALLELLPPADVRKHPRLRLMLVCIEFQGEGRTDRALTMSRVDGILDAIESSCMTDTAAVVETRYVRGMVLIDQMEHVLDLSPWETLRRMVADARSRYFEDPRFLCMALPIEIIFLLRYGLIDRAELRINELQRLNAEGRYLTNDVWACLYGAQLAFARGELDLAWRRTEEILSRSVEVPVLGGSAFRQFAESLLIRISSERGDADVVLARSRNVDCVRISLLEGWQGVAICPARAEFALGKVHEAVERLRSLLARAKDETNVHLELVAGALLCEILTRSDHLDQATELAEQIGLLHHWQTATEALTLPWLDIEALARASFHHCLVSGNVDAAKRVAGQFERLATTAGRPLDVARALTLQAQACIVERDDGTAVTLVERALSLTEVARAADCFMDAGPAIASILCEIRNRRAPDESDWLSALISGLENSFRQYLKATSLFTPRERDVLLELANGYTTKTIARNLSLSPETVKHHLKAIFEKLNVSARDDAIVEARRRVAPG